MPFDPYYKWLGIPPAEQPPNHYRLLGIVQFEQDADVIDTAASRQMAHLRTFAIGARVHESQRLLNEVATARTVLLDANKKREYDLRLQAHRPKSNFNPLGGAVTEPASLSPVVQTPAQTPWRIQSGSRGKRRSWYARPWAVVFLAASIGIVLLVVGNALVSRPDRRNDQTGLARAQPRVQPPAENATATLVKDNSSGPQPAVAPFDPEQARALQAAWAQRLGVPVELENSLGMKFVLVPPGEFTMGSAKTAHQVTLSQPMFLGVYEVTQQQYQQLMQNNPSHFQAEDHPVDNIAWTDALAFCSALSALSDERGSGRRYRLPTEAEWEFACRGGNQSVYSFGNDPSLVDDYGWHQGNSEKTTHPVGQKLPNAFGLFDLHGNVWEWCSDFVSEPSWEPQVDPTGPATGPNRVARGGCWADVATPTASRHTTLAVRGKGHGFRVAMTLGRVESTTVATRQGAASGRRGPPPPNPAAPWDANQAQRHQQNWADHLQKPVELVNSLGMKMRLVPPGAFSMGSADGAEDERPVHKVTLTKGFYLGALEVTQAQYRQVMQRVSSGRWSRRGADQGEDKRFPIDNISWHDAVEFCRRLSTWPEETNQKRNYRLPTEAEWEYASRAGTTTRWAFGDNAALLPQYEWYNERGRSSRYVSIHFVGTKTPNPWGFHDMGGNVWEWCSDIYGAYPENELVDPQGPESGAHRVVRGGCWFVIWNECRNAKRSNSGMRKHRRRLIGFRVAFTVPD